MTTATRTFKPDVLILCPTCGEIYGCGYSAGRDAIRWCEHCGTFYERFNGNAVVRVPSGNGNGNGEEEPK